MSLKELDSNEIAQIVFTVATPNAICAVLRARSDIAAIKRHLFDDAGEAQRDIEGFVRERLIDLKPKTYFPHEPAFCALAVVLETLPVPVAEKLLSELSSLEIAEMPISSRVAKLCLQKRRELLISNTLAEFRVGATSMPCESSPIRQDRLPRVQTETTYPDILKVAA